MWKRLINKISRFFHLEAEDHVDENKMSQTYRHEGQHIQPRILYQYPEKKEFRFPVIPDYEPNNREEPKRRKRYEEDPLNIIINERNTRSNVQEKEKSEKTNKKRFIPSQVASPIYGYQQRNQPKEVDIPTFIRKEKALKQTEEAMKDIANLDQNKSALFEENTTPDMETVVNITKEKDTVYDTSASDLISSEQGTAYETIGQTFAATEQLTNKETDHQTQHINTMNERKEKTDLTNKKPLNDQRILDEHLEVKEPKDKNSSVKRRNKQKKTEQSRGTGTASFPYNVIRSGIDYKSLRDQSKRAKQNDTKKYSVPFHLLDEPKQTNENDQMWIRSQQRLLEETLKHFNVEAKVVKVTQGPSVTRFEVQPQIGVKVSKVRNLSDDIKLNMAAKDIRIEAPIPGKNRIGIEVPNKTPQMVGIHEIIKTNTFKQSKSPLTVGLGLSVEGVPIVTDISKMPHGLIAGATGSGKSVCINTILISLLYKADPEEVKLLLIDPKMVELQPYNDLPHLVTPVITDVKSATAALKWAVNEMEERYEKFVDEGVRDIKRYNEKIQAENRTEKMSYIVIVIDELADLMMMSPQDVEDAICRIAQKARACGIHLLLATQRPSVDVITGLIKANIPSRIAFSVSSQVDSRTIIDNVGAERLLGKGDMLFVENGSNKNSRIQGAFVSDDEVDRVTHYVRKLGKPNFLFEQDQLLKIEMDEEEDELLDECIQFVLEQNQASVSLLQRQFRIGYNRAARIVDTLESRGIISGQNGSKPREVLISKSQIDS